jgi:hypothetical protein
MQIKRGRKPKHYWAKTKKIVEPCNTYDKHMDAYYKYRSNAINEGFVGRNKSDAKKYSFHGSWCSEKKESVFLLKRIASLHKTVAI